MMPTRFRHAAVALMLLGGMGLTFSGIAAAQGAKANAGAPAKLPDQPQNVTLTTKDQFPLHITYYKSLKGKEAPVAVLVHQEGGNRFVWQGKDVGLAERLQREGFAVVTVDLRHHGESKTAPGGNANQDSGRKAAPGKKGGSELRPGEYDAMVTYDMAAVKGFIYDEHQAGNLNMNKMGIVAAEMGAVIAVRFAASDWMEEPHSDAPPGSGFETPRGQDVRALVLISPLSSVPGIVMSQSLQALRPFPVAMSFNVSAGDTKDKGETKKQFSAAAAFDKEHKRIFLQDKYQGKLRGTDMLNNRIGLEEHVILFLNDNVMKADSQWRDRQSKLEKRKP